MKRLGDVDSPEVVLSWSKGFNEVQVHKDAARWR